ncbi:glycosyltransferase family 4 protein [Persicitalea jodogahamensis]|uniref:Glycosyl transferase family 1 domain-containing protein n=1 Tax=Persicitalea jodogahamensis TaxID=402147 RepID=A0A8J3D317_9BACT|nr:glycosyltransferase family 4 protein [Persicitalea jodogahamensis]GHB62924.1 hypothetical protein GCM10007390_15950 [Persicitalea jodogahamensis]
MKVTQISIGRFHHFHLARQLERFDLLQTIYTGYPKFKLKNEFGIPNSRIKTFPWIHAPYMKRGAIYLNRFSWLNKEWEWIDKQSLDKFVSRNISHPTILIALSGSGLSSGLKNQILGGKYICDRGSSHIRFQNEILEEEYRIWGYKFKGIDPRVIEKEEKEYDASNQITVPSEFVKQSFISMGVPATKLNKIPYGANLERFKKLLKTPSDKFRILWVGNVSIRKGFLYALEAFQNFKHPLKEFIVIGNLENEVRYLIKNRNLTHVKFLGTVPNSKLSEFYSTAHVFVLSSIEEGLAMVIGEALACGCPVIASTNTGAHDLVNDEVEGFIVPIRSADAILEKFEILAADKMIYESMSNAAILRVEKLGGWNTYGNCFKNLISKL